MSEEKPVLVMWPGMHWRLDAINAAHAEVSVFDHGGLAGTLTIRRETWDAMTHYGQRCVPESEAARML